MYATFGDRSSTRDLDRDRSANHREPVEHVVDLVLDVPFCRFGGHRVGENRRSGERKPRIGTVDLSRVQDFFPVLIESDETLKKCEFSLILCAANRVRGVFLPKEEPWRS